MPGPAYYSGIMNIAKNEDWIVPFVYTTDNGDGTFTPIDLTDSKLMMEIRRREEDHEVMVSIYSPDGGIIINDAAAGEFTLLIDRNALSQIVPGDYVGDLVREMANGFQERIWEGTANVVQGTTR